MAAKMTGTILEKFDTEKAALLRTAFADLSEEDQRNLKKAAEYLTQTIKSMGEDSAYELLYKIGRHLQAKGIVTNDTNVG